MTSTKDIYRDESLSSLSRSPLEGGAYGTYSRSERMSRMASVVAMSYDSSDIVSAAEVTDRVGRSGYKLLYSAVREGLMRRVLLPKTHNGRTMRSTFAATDLGGLWLEGYRRYMEESAKPLRPRERQPHAHRRPGTHMTPLSEVKARMDARLRSRVAQARARMEERLAARRAEAAAYETGRMRAPPV